ncbi:hypothetical protein KUCAC02_035701 [Chaenocephalus aceratus]|nr:hypothetical protein KUCAC02_035701 [Chaenocephalus aceratus]
MKARDVPITYAPPKKLGMQMRLCSTSLSLQKTPTPFLQTRPLSSPVVIICEPTVYWPLDHARAHLPKKDIHESVMYLMACYYTFHLTYPKCIATLLSVVQTEVPLGLHSRRDMTTSYKKAMADWKSS